MRYAIALAVAVLLLLVLTTTTGHTAEPKKPDPLMKRKLEHSQKVLEGIALGDFKKIEDSAEELIEISKQAEFQTIKTREYERHSNDFKRSAEGLIAAAKKKNIDAAALSYVDMTLTCVKCHKHVRDTRQTSLD